MADTYEERVHEILMSASTEGCEVFWDRTRRRPMKQAHESRWILELLQLSGHLAEVGIDALWPAFDMFWIRLHGVLTEFAADLRGKVELLRGTKHESLLTPISTSLESIRSSLSDDEVVFGDWCRQLSVHVYQRGYGLDLKKNGEVKDMRPIKVLGRSLPIHEIDEIRSRVLGISEGPMTIAVQVAKTIREPARRLHEAHEARSSGPERTSRGARVDRPARCPSSRRIGPLAAVWHSRA